MSTNTKRVLIIQDASRELCVTCVRNVLRGLSLGPRDILKLLGVIEAFTKNNSVYHKGCISILKNQTRLHSTATINKCKEDIEKATQQTLLQYSNCLDYEVILRTAEALQVEFEIAVEAGLLKEVAVQYAKNFQATHVILHRHLKRDLKYFLQNLSCGISRIKSDNSMKIVRAPMADEIGTVQQTSQNLETREERNAFINSTCSLCVNRRPRIGLKKKFTYAELQLATNGFCPQSLMSDHGRKIYLGLLNDQRKILIRESPSVTIKEEEFKREVKILERVRHEHVASLLGSCSEGPHRFLVYEYICNGSLNKHLSNKSRILTWERRISIAYGAAKGLEYLHRERIYGSMRPSNILITHDYQPLLSYYGLNINQYEALGQSSATTVLRTFEYLAPEYEESGIDLSKADVYSFGVVLVELITGRKTIQDTDGQSFLRWARPLLKKRKYMELIDPVVQDSVDLFQLYWLVRVADKCLSWDPRSRYSIRKVVTDLSCIITRSGVEDFSPTDSDL
ncbi:UNVERIFIED_CONTAM: Proline-rich receptor-like protein kinase PERK8 [Sesamum calycinum]|uniref:Proline-rich receptor-like protein kinase PERK8 n=1 Tax=Sesamum calycinum TaxID=2727403 RepID=A0AAW2RT31_9LAMI